MLQDVAARVEKKHDWKTKPSTHKHTQVHMSATTPQFRAQVLNDGLVRQDCVTQTMMGVLDATSGSVRIYLVCFGFFEGKTKVQAEEEEEQEGKTGLYMSIKKWLNMLGITAMPCPFP